MRTLLIFFWSVSACFGQLTQQAMQPFFNGSQSSITWNGTPEGMGNMIYHWVYTNLGTPATLPHATNWVDLVQAAPMNWNQLGANTKVLNTTTGVLFTAANGTRDALTNNTVVAVGTGAQNLGTNFSIFAVFRQINNNFGSTIMSMFGDFNSSSIYFANIGASDNLSMNFASITKTFVLTPNQIPIDVYMTWSNAVFWAWTNGVLAVTASAWDNSANPWQSGMSMGCKNNINFSPWHGTLAEIGFYTNIAFTTSTFTRGSLLSVSNLHWYITNTPRVATWTFNP